MKQADVLSVKYVTLKYNTMLRLTFKTGGAWDRCAHFTTANHHLAMGFVNTREQYAHFCKSDCFDETFDVLLLR